MKLTDFLQVLSAYPTYGFDDESNQTDEREPWSHVCICDLKTGEWTQITIEGKYNEQPDWVPKQVR